VTTPIIARLWKEGELILEEQVSVPEENFNQSITALFEKHLKLVGGALHMIEIEFLDEADPLQRFLRFGTDSSLMEQPVEMKRHHREV
jgi:hypothetical protein